MIYDLNCEIKVYNKLIDKTYNSIPVIIDKVIGFEIEYNVDSLTNTCNLKLPRKNAIISRKGETSGKNVSLYYYTDLTQQIGIGAKVEIKYGYNISDFGSQYIKFNGYISDITIEDTYVNIYIEDSMYLLKKAKRIQNTYISKTLKEVIEDITKDIDIELGEISSFVFQNLRIPNLLSPSEILSMLKDNYSFYFYFYDNKLYGGLRYPLSIEGKTYQFGYPYDNTKNVIASKNFKNTNSEIDESIVIINSIQTDNTTLKVYADVDNSNGVEYIDDSTLPEKDTKVELKIPNLLLAECIQQAANRFGLFRTNYIEGSFITFGEPYLKVCDIIELTLNQENQQTISTFYIDSIILKYGDGGGITQDITLGNQIN
jgi:hypothetical protein